MRAVARGQCFRIHLRGRLVATAGPQERGEQDVPALAQLLYERGGRHQAIGVIEQVHEFGYVNLSIKSDRNPSAVGHVGRKEELPGTLFDQVRSKFGVARAPQVSEVDVVMTFLPDGNETSFVTNEERRGAVAQPFIDLGQRQTVRAQNSHERRWGT